MLARKMMLLRGLHVKNEFMLFMLLLQVHIVSLVVVDVIHVKFLLATSS